jgi:hypothetical protein
MTELFVAISLFYAAWKVEIFVGLFLLALPILKRKYDNNTMIGGMIQMTTERIAQAMESDDPTSHPRDKRSKKARRRKVRGDLAKAARKANRGTSKGNKNGGGKVK